MWYNKYAYSKLSIVDGIPSSVVTDRVALYYSILIEESWHDREDEIR